MIPGLLRFADDIDVKTEVVLMTTKGEAVAIGIAQMTTSEMASVDHGVVAVIKRVVMERDTCARHAHGGTSACPSDSRACPNATRAGTRGAGDWAPLRRRRSRCAASPPRPCRVRLSRGRFVV